MKSIKLLLLLILLSKKMPGQEFKYFIETTSLDQLQIIDGSKSYSAESQRSKNDLFYVVVQNRNSLLKPICSDCEEYLTIKLFSVQENKYTKWIKLKPGETISIAECFEKHIEKKNLLKEFGDNLKAFFSFLKSARINRAGRKPTSTKSYNSIESQEANLIFVESDSSNYIDDLDLKINFKCKDEFSIQSLFVIDQNYHLSFIAGDSSILSDYYDLSKHKIPAELSDMVHQKNTSEDEIVYEVNWKLLSPYWYGKLEKEFGINWLYN